MQLVFKVDRNDTLYITDHWLCNGHWAIKRRAAIDLYDRVKKSRILGIGQLLTLKPGKYPLGRCKGHAPVSECPDIDKVVPSIRATRDNKLWLSQEVRWAGDGSLKALILLNNKGEKIGINPGYYALARHFDLYGTGPTSPILMRTSYDDVGAVMPMRLPS